MAGLTPNGLEIRVQDEIRQFLNEAVDAVEPGVDLRAGPVQAIIDVTSEELALLWETLQAVDASRSPASAVGMALDQIAALTGTRRRKATRSRVVVTCNLNSGATLPTSALLSVQGNPDALFHPTVATTNTGVSPANIDIVFESVLTGPIAAPSGKLTVRVSGDAGWNSATNAAAAELGKPVADDVELRETRRLELPSGSRTRGAIRAAVLRVDGVQEADVKENVMEIADGDGRPAKSIEVVLWDGTFPAALDNDIAQAIWDRKAECIVAHGVGSSGTAYERDDAGDLDLAQPVTVPFTRATAEQLYVSATVVLAPGTAPGWEDEAKQALEARGAKYRVGETAYASQLVCALLDTVPSIVAVVTLTLGTAPSPVGASVTADYDEIIRIDIGGHITVAEA